MRTENEIKIFNEYLNTSLKRCNKCRGADKNCKCFSKIKIKSELYKACVPKKFWFVPEDHITCDKRLSKSAIGFYAKNLNKVFKNGYGLFFCGLNGVGKTTSGAYILEHVIKKGRTVYYTTAVDLDRNFKRGFENKDLLKRINFMLSSDLIFLDEMGKESVSNKKTWINGEIGRFLKQRYDNGKPTILATNLGFNSFYNLYGSTVKSMISGRYRSVIFPTFDYRTIDNSKMVEDMEY